MSVAETVRPSVRGAEGFQVTVLLGTSGVLTGALVGFAAGIAAGTLRSVAGLDPLAPLAVAGVVLAAGLADAGARRWRTLRPLAVHRQVPQEWGRWFGARLAATLYGARLGVGPLTILTSWAWWAALLVGASLGPWPSAAVGATFALTRTVVTVVAGAGAGTGDAMRRRMARVLAAERWSAWSTSVVLAGAAAVAAVA